MANNLDQDEYTFAFKVSTCLYLWLATILLHGAGMVTAVFYASILFTVPKNDAGEMVIDIKRDDE